MKELAKAIAIVKDISSDKFTDEEKAEAIYLVMNMATHNCVTKTDFLNVIKWLWDRSYEYVEVEEE